MSLAETVNEEDIVDLGEEVNAPNILIDNNYGISGGYADYALVQKKVAYRTGKEEDGENNGKVIKYIKWEDVNYAGTIFGVFTNYVHHVSLAETKKLKKCKDFQEIADIYNNIYATIKQALKCSKMSNDVEGTLNLTDKMEELNNDISEIRKVLEEAEELRAIIKEKRKIIIKD